MNDLWTHRDWLLHRMPNIGPPSSEPACFEPMGIELESCGFLRPNERQMLHWYTASIPVVRKDGSTEIAVRICHLADIADGQLPPFGEIEALNAVGLDIKVPGYPRYPRPATLSDCGIGGAYGLASEWLDPVTE